MSNCGGMGTGAFNGGTKTPPANPPFALLAIAGLVAIKDIIIASITKSQRCTSTQWRASGTVARTIALATGGAVRKVAAVCFTISSLKKVFSIADVSALTHCSNPNRRAKCLNFDGGGRRHVMSK